MKLLRSLVGLLIVGAMVYVGWKMVPPYLAYYQMEEAMDDTARALYVNYAKQESEFREQLMKQARELEVPLTEEKLHIERGQSDYYVWGEYSVHVDLPFYPVDLQFHPASKSQKRRM